MSDIKRKRLEAVIRELEKIRGRHTELVTVYVPAGFNLAKVVEQIRTEQSTAQNIKSKAVRKNVLGALERILQHLKLYRETPEKGLAIFCGNVSEKEGVADIEIWALEPPEQVKQRLYRCDQTFILGPLKEMVRETEVYGLVVLDKSEAEIGLLSGKKVESLKHLESIVPGKTKAGGWCVHEDTLLHMEDGKTCKIRDVGNRKFLCYDFKNNKTTFVKHNHFFSRTSKEALKIETDNPKLTIKVTPEHMFFVRGRKGIETKPASRLKVNDVLLSVEKAGLGFKLARIASLKVTDASGIFYDMEILNHGNFIANGIILHNSANRYARIREGLLHDFLKKIGDVASSQFKELKDLKGVIVGGPGPIKEMFAEGDFLDYTMKQKIIGVISTSYTGEYGLHEMIERADDVLTEASVIKEKHLLDRFFGEFEKDSGLATYGLREVMEALKSGNIELLLISEGFDWIKVVFDCKCGQRNEKVIRKQHAATLKCSKCGAEPESVEKKDIVDDIVKLAESMSTQVEMISTDTPKGIQLRELGGIAGILRYKA